MDDLRERSVMSLAVLLAHAPLLVDVWAPRRSEESRASSGGSARGHATGPHGGRGAAPPVCGARSAGSVRGGVRVADGEPILVVSDADAGPERAPIPSVLAVGAVNVALTNAGPRTRCSIVAEVDDARSRITWRACSPSARRRSVFARRRYRRRAFTRRGDDDPGVPRD